MKQFMGRLLLLCFVCCIHGIGIAQDQTMPPPKVLMIIREFLKPGKAGTPHLKTESAFVNAFTSAKWPQHYFAVDSLSGMPRSLFLVGYDSFASWEKDNAATQKNAALSGALDKASIADGELLSSYESSTFVLREDLSYQAPVNIAQMRFFEISHFHVKPGHSKDFEALAKMYQDGYRKAVPDAHWAVFEDMYGMDSGGTFLVFVPMKSLAEVDKGFGDSKKVSDAMGEEGMKKLSDLTASAIDQAESNLFVFNPKISYPPDEWVKADPEFWKQKSTAPAKTSAKPAQ